MSRAFVAVTPPAEVLDAVDATVARVRDGMPGAKWTRREQWHLTLQFLGNRVDLEAVSAALAPLALGAGAVRLGGAGAFPSERRGRVLWIGVREGPLLTRLAAAVGALLAPIGYEPEARLFHPHLTMARLARSGDLRPVVEALGPEPVGPAWVVSKVVLYESLLRREGARYEAVAAFPLVGGAGGDGAVGGRVAAPEDP